MQDNHDDHDDIKRDQTVSNATCYITRYRVKVNRKGKKMQQKKRTTGFLLGISPLVIIGVFLVLVPIFIFITIDSMQAHNQRAVEMLTERGGALMRSFEAGARTGMLAMRWKAAKVQRLLMETAFQPDIEYIMITDKKGSILAHSTLSKTGGTYENMPDLSKVTFERVLAHREMRGENNKIFEVYKKFTPSRPPRPHGRGRPDKFHDELSMGKHYPPMPDWCRAHFFKGSDQKTIEPEQYIFAGFNMEKIEASKKEYLFHVIFTGIILFFIGCAGIFSLFVMQAYRSAKKSITSLEKEVERSRRLAAIGKLAAGVAHEIRNPLSSIKGFATYFKERFEDSQEEKKTATIMIDEVERLNRSVTQLLEFAGPISVSKAEVDCNELLDHSLLLVKNDLTSKKIEYETVIRTKKNSLMLDRDRMNQVLLNLYLNAIEAMESGGKLTVRVLDMESGGRVCFEVSDTGKGIGEADIEHIFDPYYTTRNTGTGLGLAVVYKIVETLGGEITAKSSLGKGTTFFIQMPC